MKKHFKYYAACWGIALALFQVLAFAPPAPAGMQKYTGSFWVGYIFITVAFAGQLACAWWTFRAQNLQKMFYRLPLITVSYLGLGQMLLYGGVCMAAPGIPKWLGAVLCCLVLGLSAIAVTQAAAAGDTVAQTDAAVQAKTSRMRLLTAQAESLCVRAAGGPATAACRQVYQALRYTDPVSTDALAVWEDAIAAQLEALTTAVRARENEKAQAAAKELCLLVGERNERCKVVRCNE